MSGNIERGYGKSKTVFRDNSSEAVAPRAEAGGLRITRHPRGFSGGVISHPTGVAPVTPSLRPRSFPGRRRACMVSVPMQNMIRDTDAGSPICDFDTADRLCHNLSLGPNMDNIPHEPSPWLILVAADASSRQ